MYPAINNSPITTLASAITASTTTLEVVDPSVFPAAPNILTIGTDETAELILYTGISGATLTGCTRGFNGTAKKAWPVGSKMYRAHTAYDHDTFKANIEDIARNLGTQGTAIGNLQTGLSNLGTTVVNNKTTTDQAIADLSHSVDEEIARIDKAIQEGLVRGTHIYGVKWDKTNAACTRVFEAAGITTDTTNFAHKGSLNENYSNPFDSIYPWNMFRMCNVDLEAYKALTVGDDIRDAVTAWEGEPDFSITGSNGFVGRYRPQYWYTAYADSEGNYLFAVASGKMDGWAESKPCIDGFAFGVDDGTGASLTCNSGQPLSNVALSTIHTRANSAGFSLQNIYSFSAIVTAYVVEYANMNAQAAIGNGCDALYRQSSEKPLIAETGAHRVVLPRAFAAVALDGATLDFGASNGAVVLANRRRCTGYEEYAADADYISVTFDDSLDVTTDMFVSVHGCVNGSGWASGLGSHTGYIGTNGKVNVFYRGAILHANRYHYVLGAYRQTGTAEIWICPNEDDCDRYNALNTSVHKDTGLHLPIVDGAAKDGYIGELGIVNGLGAVPFCTSVTGGSSTAPVGDYCYSPALTTGNTILLVGGSAFSGANCGPFYGGWYNAASYSYWSCVGWPHLKTP